MNQDRDNKLPGSESDPMVSAQYRAAATERTPPALDAAVLKQAETAAKTSGLRGFTAHWFRPLAFVATLGLSLALLLELSSTDPEFGVREAAPTVEDVKPRPLGITGAVQRSDDTPAAREDPVEAPATLLSPNKATGRMQAPAASSANAPSADVDTSADFAEMIEASSKQMQERDSVTDAAIADIQQTQTAVKEQVGDVASFRSSAYMLKQAARPCTEDQIAVPAEWWQCIADLEEAGRHDEAKIELELFSQAYPDFEAPEILPSQ